MHGCSVSGDAPVQNADELIDEYVEEKRFVEEEKPYWMNLRNPRDGEMRYELNNYFPDAHYKRAIDEALESEVVEDLFDDDDDVDEMLPDGGIFY